MRKPTGDKRLKGAASSLTFDTKPGGDGVSTGDEAAATPRMARADSTGYTASGSAGAYASAAPHTDAPAVLTDEGTTHTAEAKSDYEEKTKPKFRITKSHERDHENADDLSEYTLTCITTGATATFRSEHAPITRTKPTHLAGVKQWRMKRYSRVGAQCIVKKLSRIGSSGVIPFENLALKCFFLSDDPETNEEQQQQAIRVADYYRSIGYYAEAFTHHSKLFLVMNWFGEHDLFTAITTGACAHLSPAQCLLKFKQLIENIERFHQLNRVPYSDLKPENIIFGPDHSLTPVDAEGAFNSPPDFTLGYLSEYDIEHHLCVTIKDAGPPTRFNVVYSPTFASDFRSLATIFALFSCQIPPYLSYNEKTIRKSGLCFNIYTGVRRRGDHEIFDVYDGLSNGVNPFAQPSLRLQSFMLNHDSITITNTLQRALDSLPAARTTTNPLHHQADMKRRHLRDLHTAVSQLAHYCSNRFSSNTDTQNQILFDRYLTELTELTQWVCIIAPELRTEIKNNCFHSSSYLAPSYGASILSISNLECYDSLMSLNTSQTDRVARWMKATEETLVVSTASAATVSLGAGAS